MKRIYFLFGMLLMSSIGLFAQDGTDCKVTLSLEHDMVQARKYDEALTYWNKLYKDCPKESEAVYSDGIKIFKAKYKAAKKANDQAALDTYKAKIVELYNKWVENFPDTKYGAKICHDKGYFMYTNKMADKEELYKIFSHGFKKDKTKFTNPKALYGYFDAATEMYKKGKISFEDLINIYDEVLAANEALIEKYTLQMEDLQKKEEAGELMKKEEKRLKAIRTNIPVYTIVSKKMDQVLGDLGDCQHLVPLYQKNFDENKDNAAWLRKAAQNLSKKDCSNDPIFGRIVTELDRINPSYSSAYFLGKLNQKKGKISTAVSYYKKAIDLADKAYDKAKIYYILARISAKQGQKSQARSYAYKALEFKPSMGAAYLLIAHLYSKSADACGTDKFSKGATFWLAASMADKAAKVDPSIAKAARKAAAKYRSYAPSKTDVFMSGKAGQSIPMKCWIGGSVTVPKQ